MNISKFDFFPLSKGKKSSQFSSVAQSCPALCNPMDCSVPGSSVHGDSPAKNTGEGCHALLQGIFLTERSNSDLLHCRHILYHLICQGSPRILEWVVMPFSRGYSWPRNQTRVSCIIGGLYQLSHQGRSLCLDQLYSQQPRGGFPCGSAGKESAHSVRSRLGFDPWVGEIPWRREGYPLQYSGLENSMDCIVHGVSKSWTQLSNFHFHFQAVAATHLPSMDERKNKI